MISRWQPPRLVGLPETILKGGRDEKYLKVGEMKNTKDGRDEKLLKVGEMKNTERWET